MLGRPAGPSSGAAAAARRHRAPERGHQLLHHSPARELQVVLARERPQRPGPQRAHLGTKRPRRQLLQAGGGARMRERSVHVKGRGERGGDGLRREP